MLDAPANFADRFWRFCLAAFCMAVLIFIMAPLLAMIPLSLNSQPYLTFTEGMLRLDAEAYSLRWYRNVLEDEQWLRAFGNSLFIGVCATAIATSLGTLAALGLASPAMPAREQVMGFLISPFVIPAVISATGMLFFYAKIGLGQTYSSVILAHAVLSAPFVVITVTATLSGFNHNLMRAAASLGANPLVAFRDVQLPLIAPGVASGALFAFATSFDEIIAVLYLGGLEHRTIPRQMWSGIREEFNPEILVVASFLMLSALLLFGTVEWLRRKAA